MDNRFSKLHHGISFELLSRAVFITTGYLVYIILGRHFGPEKFAEIALILAILNIYNIFMANGVRQVIASHAAQPQINLKTFWVNSLRFQALISLVIVTVVSLFYYLSVSFFPKDTGTYILLSVLVVPLSGLYFLQIGLLNGLCMFRAQALVGITYSGLKLILISIFIFVLGMKTGGVITAIGLAYFVAFLTRYLFINKLSDNGEDLKVKDIARKSFAFMYLYLFIALFLNIDVLIQNNILKDSTEAGVYAAASTIGRVSYFMFFVLISSSFPIISKYWKNRDFVSFKKMCLKICIMMFCVTIVLGLLSCSFPEHIITTLFGNAYGSGSKFIPVHMMAICLLSINLFLSNLFLISQKVRMVIVTHFLALVLFVFISYSSSSVLGSMAVPVSLLISVVVLLAITAVSFHRSLPAP